MEKDFIEDELCSVNNELNGIVDEMIEKYGKFLKISDTQNLDRYSADLVRNYNALMKQKEYLSEQLKVID
jgi:hypothetical protein